MPYPIRALTDRAVEQITDYFNEKNFIGKFQFGKVYRGVYSKKEVTVKVWEEDQRMYKILPGDNRSRAKEELILHEHLREQQSHSNIAYLIGDSTCADEKILALAYELKALDTLYNLLVKVCFSYNLTWAQSIKIALGSASAIEFFHSENPLYLIRNICAQHMMLDQELNPILYDFSMISGGIFTDRRNLLNQYVDGCHGYIDPIWARPGKWSTKCDVFSNGVLLLELITKKVYTEESYFSHGPLVYEWAATEYERQISFGKSEASLVHHSFKSEPNFCAADGIKVTNLALRCVLSDPRKRPTMKQVVKHLKELRIFQPHATVLGIDRMPSIDVASMQIQKIPGRRSSKEECGVIEVFSYEALGMLTGGFNKENLIGKFQFGKLFHGKLGGRKVTVKIWECFKKYRVTSDENEDKLRDELALLQHPRLSDHPHMVKLIGYCQEGENFGVVYDLESFNTLYNLLPEGTFTWLQRMKVAIQFAFLLKYLHAGDPQHLSYLVRNIDANHIMLDEERRPKLIDFGMFAGGILPDVGFKLEFVCGSYGYIDPDLRRGYWSEKCDVFSYGVVLLNLISKRIYTEDDLENCRDLVYGWACEEYEKHFGWPLEKFKNHKLSVSKSKFCLVHPSLEADVGFHSRDARKITEQAMQCVRPRPYDRPTMKQVVRRLLKLRAARHLARELGVRPSNSS